MQKLVINLGPVQCWQSDPCSRAFQAMLQVAGKALKQETLTADWVVENNSMIAVTQHKDGDLLEQLLALLRETNLNKAAVVEASVDLPDVPELDLV